MQRLQHYLMFPHCKTIYWYLPKPYPTGVSIFTVVQHFNVVAGFCNVFWLAFTCIANFLTESDTSSQKTQWLKFLLSVTVLACCRHFDTAPNKWYLLLVVMVMFVQLFPSFLELVWIPAITWIALWASFFLLDLLKCQSQFKTFLLCYSYNFRV